SEEAVDDLSGVLDLSRQSGARGMGNTLSDDGRCAGEVVFGIGKMHGAAKSLTQPVFPAIEFGHHFFRRRAEHDGLSMATIARHREVFGVTRGEHSYNRSFRAVGKMGVAAHGSGMFEESALDVLFEFANPCHLDVDPDQPVFPEDIVVWHASLLRRRD